MADALESSFIVHRASSNFPADRLLAFFHEIYGNYGPYNAVVWLEIGSGFPWNQDLPHCY
jgi:hypothetical protein